MSKTDITTCQGGRRGCEVIRRLRELERDNQRLSALVHSDNLTGLHNHRHLMEALAAEMERTARSGQPTGLVMVDLDHFKRVNDTWGHEVGNQALVHAAALLRKAVRRIDDPCRYGGEEFALILPGTGIADAVATAERVRKSIEKTPLKVARNKLSLTASLGVAVYTGLERSSPEQLVEAADGYLYQAKQGGRNRVAHPPFRAAGTSQVTADERAMLFT